MKTKTVKVSLWLTVTRNYGDDIAVVVPDEWTNEQIEAAVGDKEELFDAAEMGDGLDYDKQTDVAIVGPADDKEIREGDLLLVNLCPPSMETLYRVNMGLYDVDHMLPAQLATESAEREKYASVIEADMSDAALAKFAAFWVATEALLRRVYIGDTALNYLEGVREGKRGQ